MGKTYKIQRVRYGKVDRLVDRDKDRKDKRIRIAWHIAQRRKGS